MAFTDKLIDAAQAIVTSDTSWSVICGAVAIKIMDLWDRKLVRKVMEDDEKKTIHRMAKVMELEHSKADKAARRKPRPVVHK